MSDNKEDINPLVRDSDEIEIHLSDIVGFLRRSQRFILLGAIVGAVISGVYAFSKRNEYTSQLTVMPELQQKTNNMSSLGSLAGLAGIDVSSLAGSSDVIRPDLYPNVIQSVPFNIDLLNQPVNRVNSNTSISLDAYLSETDQSWLDNNPFSWGAESTTNHKEKAGKSDLLQLTRDQEEKIKTLQSRLAVIYDKKSGIISIQSTMNDPIVAATTARYTLNYLTDYITGYRTEKARKEVKFLGEQMALARQRYQSAEYALSSYRDKNRSLFLNTAKIEEQRIQADYLLAQDVYNTLSKQYETSKIKVAEETPVFKVLEPARIPLKKSGPKRSVIVVFGVIMGIILAISVRLIRVLMARSL